MMPIFKMVDVNFIVYRRLLRLESMKKISKHWKLKGMQKKVSTTVFVAYKNISAKPRDADGDSWDSVFLYEPNMHEIFL